MISSYEKKSFVSVIMPTYNQADYITQAIESVLLQKHTDFELIIIDNFSTDETYSLIQSFNDSRIKYHKYNNKGVIAAARNYGVAFSSGSVIAFLDSDDIWEDKFLSSQMKLLSGSISVVCSSFHPIGNKEKCIHHLNHISSNEIKEYTYQEILKSNPIMTSSVVLRRDSFNEVDGFDDDLKFRFIEDWDLWIRLSYKANVLVNGNRLLKYRISSKTDRDLRDVKLRTLHIIQKQYDLKYISLYEKMKLFGNCYVDIGKAHLDMGDYLGVYYYLKGFLLCYGLKNKVRAIIGTLLYLLPCKKRKKLIDFLYSINSKFSKKQMPENINEK